MNNVKGSELMLLNIDISKLLDWRYLLVFGIGTAIGFFLVLLVYLYSATSSRRKRRVYKRNPVEIDEIEIENLIKDAQERFKDKEERKKLGMGKQFYLVNRDLTTNIAEKYYPTSKYPTWELTIEESLELINYISDRLNQLFKDIKVLVLIKRKTVADLISKFDHADDKKETKRAIRIVTDWVKKNTIDRVIGIVLVKVALVSIGIVGEETYKIYSKSVFMDPEDLSVDIDQLYKDLGIDT